MKNKKMVLLPIGLLLIVLIGGIVRFVLPQQTENIITTQLYFLNESDTTIVPEIQKIHYDTAYDIPRQVIAALQKEPQNKKYHPVLGMDTELLQLQVENGTVVCDFSKEFLAPERGSVILSVYAVIKTLCQLEGVRAMVCPSLHRMAMKLDFCLIRISI